MTRPRRADNEGRKANSDQESTQIGNFYVNFTVRSPHRDAVIDALQREGRDAFITPASCGMFVVYDQQSDKQIPSLIKGLARRTAKVGQGPVLAVLNHDDDFFTYWLLDHDTREGMLADRYRSRHGEPQGEKRPEGGDPDRLCVAFSPSDDELANARSEQIKAILNRRDFVFEVERHIAFVGALGLPTEAVGFGYAQLAAGEFPPALGDDEVTRIKSR